MTNRLRDVTLLTNRFRDVTLLTNRLRGVFPAGKPRCLLCLTYQIVKTPYDPLAVSSNTVCSALDFVFSVYVHRESTD